MLNRTDQQLSGFLKRYKRCDEPIEVDFRTLVNWIPYGERATHMIHSYPAKLLLHIPHYFLCNEILSKADDVVLDPFCGTGTVMLETILSGRNGIGIDINPLACLISKVKTTALNREKLKATGRNLRNRISSPSSSSKVSVINIEYWYYPRIIKGLKSISEAVNQIRDENMKNFFLVCFSALARKVSLADPRISVPVKFNVKKLPKSHYLRISEEKRLKYIKKVDLVELFFNIVNTNIERMDNLKSLYNKDNVSAQIFTGNAQLLSDLNNNIKIDDNSIDLIMTSPPYAGAQKYIRASKLNLGWTGLCEKSLLNELEKKTIGRESALGCFSKNEIKTGIKPADTFLERAQEVNPFRAQIAGLYLNEMRLCVEEMHRVLKKGRYLVLVVGDNFVCGRQFKISKYLQSIAENFGFKLRLRLIDSINSRGLMTKRNKTANMITKEWILLFQKEY